jgi:hypothetical protein
MSAVGNHRRLLPQRRAATPVSLRFGSVDYVCHTAPSRLAMPSCQAWRAIRTAKVTNPRAA